MQPRSWLREENGLKAFPDLGRCREGQGGGSNDDPSHPSRGLRKMKAKRGYNWALYKPGGKPSIAWDKFWSQAEGCESFGQAGFEPRPQ